MDGYLGVVRRLLLVIFASVVLLTAGQATAPVQASTPVYADSSGSCGGLGPCFTSIQAAVDNAGPPPAEVFVFPGTYPESVDLDSMGSSIASSPGDITMTAVDSLGVPSPGTVTVNPSTDPAIYTSWFPSGFPGSVTLDGFVVTSPNDDGISISADGAVVIRNITAQGNGYRGIAADTSSTWPVTVSASSVTGSSGNGVALSTSNGLITIADVTVVYSGERGIDLNSLGGVIDVDRASASGSGFEGLAINTSSGDITVTATDADGNGSDGINLNSSDGAITLTDVSVFSNVGDDGVDVNTWGGNVSVGAATAVSNADDGIRINTFDGVLAVEESVAASSGSDGFDLSTYSGALTVLDSQSLANGENGVRLLGGTTTPQISGSTICGNGNSGLHVEAAVVNAEGNWWGDASGPNHPSNPGGSGDEIEDGDNGGFGAVDFDPWATSDPDGTCGSMSKQAPTSVPASIGASVDYAITVENNIPDTASDVVVMDYLPDAVQFVSGSWVKSDPPDTGTCSAALGMVSCPVGDIAPDGSATISLATALSYFPLEGALFNMACWFSDNRFNDDCAVAATGVGQDLASADLTLFPPSGPLTIDRILNTDVDYDLVVANSGPGTVSSSVVTVSIDSDLQPASSTWDSSLGGSGTCTTSGRTITCSIGNLTEGSTAVVHVETDLANTAAPDLRMHACVAPADTNPQNNCRQWKTHFLSSNRKVIFIQGINSGSDCQGEEDGFASRVEWMELYLTGANPAGRWVGRSIQLFPRIPPSVLGDFRYFSYSSDYSCPGEMAKYGPTDTCDGIPNAADRLNNLIEDLIDEDPNVSFDLIAHSMGGPVAAHWIVNHRNTAKQRVNSVVTFDSPLKGVPMQNAMFLGTVLWGGIGGNACNATDPSVGQLYSPLWPQSPLVRTWQKAGGRVPFYTIDATRGEARVPWLGEAVPGWPHDRTSIAGQRKHTVEDADHSGIWEGDRKDELDWFVACAVTQAGFCTPVQEELTDLQTGEERRVEAIVSPEDVTLAVAALWGEGIVEATLEAPDGTVIDAATVDENVRHSADEGYDLYEVDHPLPGIWSIVVAGVDMPDGGGDVSVRADMLGVPPPDEDEDGVPDGEDNCQSESNADQSNVDGDNDGDDCDTDADDDGFLNEPDNCPYVSNPDQDDLDGDGLGEPCDGDNDNDNMLDADEEIHECLSTSENEAADDEDEDTLINLEEVWLGTDPCVADSDGDDFDDGVELLVGTDPVAGCPTVVGAHDAWPCDFDKNRVINILDVNEVLPPHFGMTSSSPGWDPRYDLQPDGVINILDVNMTLPPFFGSVCTP